MTIEQFAIGLTLIVTILGWFYTHRKQVEILKVTRKHNVTDRELAAIRESMSVVRELNKSIHVTADDLRRLAQNARSLPTRKELQIQFTKVLDNVAEYKSLLSDPEFIWLRSQLPDAEADRIRQSMVAVGVVASRLTQDQDEEMDDDALAQHITEGAIEVAEALETVARTISEAFASLHSTMASR